MLINNQNLCIFRSPEEARPLFYMVLGVSSCVFSETVSLLLVFFFLWVMEGVMSWRGERISFLFIFKGVLR